MRRRSELATPGSNEWMFETALRSGADLVFLDLEDAVAEDEKAAARRKVVGALRDLDWGATVRAVRINEPGTEHAQDDLDALVGEDVDVVVVPKVRTATQVAALDERLGELERARGVHTPIRLEILVETVAALVHVVDIAAASARIDTLVLGGGDLSADLGARYGAGFLPYDADVDVWHYARWQVLCAARAAGVEAVDTPMPDFQDEAAYRRQATRAYHMGFIGKWAIHPAQVPLANECFSPTAEDIRISREVVEAYDESQRKGLGAASYGGAVIDVANVRIAQRIADAASTELQHR